MKPLKKITLILGLMLLTNCGQKPESMIPYLEGYWEITEVEKNGDLIKTYSISMNIDYFKVNPDHTGFRKKVTPNLEGTFTVTEHEVPFVLKTVKNELQIHYSENGISYFETIKKASDSILIIKNSDGFRYTYKPYTTLDLAP